MYGSDPRRGGGGGSEFLGWDRHKFSGPLLQNFKYISGILSFELRRSPVDWHPNWVKGGSVDMSKSQRRTRSGACRGVSQTNEAANNPKHTGLCQHEMR